MKKSRLFVISIKDIIYTLIFALLGILLIVLLFLMFLPKDESSKETKTSNTYIPGVYTSCMTLDDTSFTLQLTIDKDSINSVDLINEDETVSAAYPLIPLCIDNIEAQLVTGTDIDELSYETNSKYTQLIITEAIKDLLNKATN